MEHGRDYSVQPDSRNDEEGGTETEGAHALGVMGGQVLCCCGLRAAEHGHGREKKFTLERRLYPMKKYKRVPRPTDDLMGEEQGI